MNDDRRFLSRLRRSCRRLYGDHAWRQCGQLVNHAGRWIEPGPDEIRGTVNAQIGHQIASVVLCTRLIFDEKASVELLRQMRKQIRTKQR